MSIEVYCKRFGGGKSDSANGTDIFFSALLLHKKEIKSFLFSVLDISNFEFCTSKRRKVEIGSFRACIFDGNIENAICIKSRAPCEHRRRRGRVVCVHATAELLPVRVYGSTCVKETAAEIKPRITTVK